MVDFSLSTVFVVDDDIGSCQIVSLLVRNMSLSARTFESAEEFLSGNCHFQPGCVVADLRMAGMSGLAMLSQMRTEKSSMPFILVTAYADVTVTVDALHHGALVVLEKPFRHQVLWDYIVQALKQDHDQRASANHHAQLLDRIQHLNEDESRILEMIVRDVPNRVISSRLQISLRTVDHRRAQILAKLGMENLRALIWNLGAAGWPSESARLYYQHDRCD